MREGGRPPRGAAHYSINQYCAGGRKAAKEGRSFLLIILCGKGGRPLRRAAHNSIDQYSAGGGEAANEGRS